jgi:hypothetical protein
MVNERLAEIGLGKTDSRYAPDDQTARARH